MSLTTCLPNVSDYKWDVPENETRRAHDGEEAQQAPVSGGHAGPGPTPPDILPLIV